MSKLVAYYELQKPRIYNIIIGLLGFTLFIIAKYLLKKSL